MNLSVYIFDFDYEIAIVFVNVYFDILMMMICIDWLNLKNFPIDAGIWTISVRVYDDDFFLNVWNEMLNGDVIFYVMVFVNEIDPFSLTELSFDLNVKIYWIFSRLFYSTLFCWLNKMLDICMVNVK